MMMMMYFEDIKDKQTSIMRSLLTVLGLEVVEYYNNKIVLQVVYHQGIRCG